MESILGTITYSAIGFVLMVAGIFIGLAVLISGAIQ